MSAISCQLPYQRAVFKALSADSALTAIVGARIYDNVPQAIDGENADDLFPYVQLGELTGMAWNCSGPNYGQDVTLTIHVWSREKGKKEMKTIMGHVYRILEDNKLTTTVNDDGVTVITHHVDYENDFLDPDGVTNHGVQRFRALIQGGT